MSKDRHWGDELTLRAAVEAYSCIAHIISSEEQNWYLVYTPESKMTSRCWYRPVWRRRSQKTRTCICPTCRRSTTTPWSCLLRVIKECRLGADRGPGDGADLLLPRRDLRGKSKVHGWRFDSPPSRRSTRLIHTGRDARDASIDVAARAVSLATRARRHGTPSRDGVGPGLIGVWKSVTNNQLKW